MNGPEIENLPAERLFFRGINGPAMTKTSEELEAQFHIIVPAHAVINGPLAQRNDFFMHAARMKWRTDGFDLGIAQRLARAMVAEFNDPEPLNDPWTPRLDPDEDGA